MAKTSLRRSPRAHRLYRPTASRSRSERFFRHTRLESLEPRWVLSASPTLAAIADVTVVAGAPLHVALDGFDVDGDALSYLVSTTNGDLSATVHEGNRSLRIVVEGYGDMVFELFEDLAPGTTARIIELAEAGFFDDLIFHRVAEYTDGTPFVIQGGDPDGTGTGGSGVDFDDEFSSWLRHTSAGVLSMAKSNDDTNDSQFFITATDTRHLDFNHSVFGFLVEGDSVREAIQSVETDDDSKPLVDVVMQSVDVFFDEENGALMLSAPEGTTGEADVTVTVDDGNGGTATRTFHVNIVADTTNDNPYLLPIADLTTTSDTPVSFTIPATDVEGDDVYFAGVVYPESDDLAITVSEDDGVTTVTPTAAAAGVYGIFVGVRSPDGSTWDTQAVPVFVNPSAPTAVTLLTSSDTGASTSDGVTTLNNSAGEPLWFRVDGVFEGAEVSIYADGALIGQAMATSNSVVVVTSATLTLADGAHAITARQVLRDQTVDIGNVDDTVDLASAMSSALSITIDTIAPVITSDPVLGAGAGVLYEYNVESNAETDGEALYRLTTSPAGMVIDSETGVITWTPQTTQGDEQSVVVVVSDRAGNETSQSFEININQAPVIWTIGDRAIEEQSLLSFTVVATDAAGDLPIVFSLGAAPEGTAIDPLSGVFTWTPSEAQGPGQYSVTIRATDSTGAVNRQTILVTVTEKNEPPVLAAIDDAAIDEGEVLQFTAVATDPDLPANELTFSLATGSPAGAKIDPATAVFTWRPGESQGGQTLPIVIRVTDSAGATDEQAFHVAVAEVDDPPVFAPVETQVVAPGMSLRVQAEATDPDLPTNAIRYALEPGAPEGVALDPVTGVLAWDVPADHPVGTVELRILATEVLPDGTPGLATCASLNVIVTNFSAAAFDEALAVRSSESPLETRVAREATDGLLFGEARPMRFIPVLRASLAGGPLGFTSGGRPDEGALGFRISSSRRGGGTVISADEGKKADAPERSGQSAGKSETPDVSAPKVKPVRRNADGGKTEKDVPEPDKQTENVPPEVLDAALEQLAQEAAAAEEAEAIEAAAVLM